MQAMKWAMVAAGTAVLGVSTGWAQTAPISRTIPVTFTGTVTGSAGNSLMVRQPDGSMTPYAGPLPDYPYAVGDAVTISFNATLPTREFYDSVYAGQKAADGIYRITVSSPYYNGGTAPGGIGNSTAADVSGPISPALNSGQPTNTRMTIVYDYNTDSYAIEGSGSFVSGAYSLPGYLYDAASGAYLLCGTSGQPGCLPSASYDPILSSLSGGADGSRVNVANVRVLSTDPASGTGTGVFSLSFLGSWSLPQAGGATPVPEPGMLLLFGAASALLPLRRRLRRAA